MRFVKILRLWKFFLIYNLVIRSCLPHVVFEEFGTMAGSVSYMHITLHINLTHIDHLVRDYKQQCVDLKDQIAVLLDVLKKDQNKGPAIKASLEGHGNRANEIIDTFMIAADEEMSIVQDLREILPTDQKASPQRLVYRESRSADGLSNIKTAFVSKGAQEILELLAKKGLHIPGAPSLSKFRKFAKIAKVVKGISPLSMGLSIVKGVFGTFMGIYNAFQMEKLRRDLNGVIQTQNRVLEVIEDQQSQLDDLTQELIDLKLHFKVFSEIDKSLITTILNRGLNTIRSAVHQAVHAIQQAHHHRLAIDYYDPETLTHIYSTLKEQADSSKYHLLTRFPSDLFQLELSYLFDGTDVVMFLHVPMIPKDSLLTLYRLKPFPIPFSETMALLPKPSSSLLALSNGIPRTMTQITHADLIDCHSVNQIFLCERHGVLKRHIKSTCLGALFEQDIRVAQQVCDLELVPYEESVLQLKNNWFLIYSPILYTAYIQCFNSSSSAKPIKVGVNNVFVDPSCHMELINHTLTSDLSMKLDAEITYFPWELADLSAFSVTEEDITAALAVRTSAGERNIYLADVIQHKHFSSAIPKWKWILATFIFTGIMALIFLILASMGTHRVVRFRRRMRKIRNAVNQIAELPVIRNISRRPSMAPELGHDNDDHDPLAPPPLYPGVPKDEDDSYELMNLNPRSIAHSLRSLHQMSRTASRISRSLRSGLHTRRSTSLPPSHHASRVSFNPITDADSDSFFEDDRMSVSSRPRSVGSRFHRSVSTAPLMSEKPTPTPRSKTPSYVFLKATATSEV